MRNYNLIKEWFDLSDGYSETILEQMFNELQAKTYGRFIPFFEKQILNCCELSNVWKPLLTQKILLMNRLSQEAFISPDDLKKHYTTNNGNKKSESGSIDGTSFSFSDDNTYDDFDYDKYSERLSGLLKYVDDQIKFAIRRYNLDSMLVGFTNYMCGGCPMEDPQCNDCGCEDWACQ